MFKKIFFPLFFIFCFTVIFFRKLFLGFIPIPFDLLVSWFFPYNSGGWTITGRLTQYKGGHFASDAIRQIYPWRELAVEIMKKGEIPLWNPFNFSGTPLLANIQSSVFYPFNIIFFIIPSFPWAWAVYILLTVLLGGLFMYLFLDLLTGSKRSALFGALAFSASGYMVSWLEWGVIPHTMIWLPLSLFSLKKWQVTTKKKYLMLWLFSGASTILAGYPPGSAYNFIIVASYYLYLFFTEQRRRRFSFGMPILAVFMMILGITAVQWIPTAEIFFHSAMKSEVSQQLSREAAMPVAHFATLLAPDYFGNRATDDYWAKSFSRLDYMDADLFVGVVTLPLALYALLTLKSDKEKKWLVALLLSGIILGGKTPISKLVADLGIPVIGTGAAAEALTMLIFAIICLAALGFNQLQQKPIRNKFLISLAILSCLYLVLGVATFFLKPEYALIARRNLVIPLLSFIVSAFIIISSLIYRGRYSKTIYILPIILSIELILHADKILPFSSYRFAYPEHILVKNLRSKANTDRIAGFWETEFATNFHTAFRLYSSEGYDPLYIRRYGEFMTSAQQGKLIKDIPRSDADLTMENETNRNRLLDLASIKYIHAKVTDPLQYWEQEPLKYDPKRFKLVWQQDKFKIYENLYALPRVKLFRDWKVINDPGKIIETLYSPDFDPSKTVILESNPPFFESDSKPFPSASETDLSSLSEQAKIIHFSPNHVEIQTESQNPEILLFTDTYYPGWKATIDGKSTSILRANYTFRSLSLPKGKHQIHFFYKPLSFTIGLILTLLSALFFLFFMIRFSQRTFSK